METKTNINKINCYNPVTTEALDLISVDRAKAYGSPLHSLRQIAKVWSGILGAKLGEPITWREVSLMMAGLKLVREQRRPKRDNLVDVCGYMEIYQIAEQLEQEENPNYE